MADDDISEAFLALTPEDFTKESPHFLEHTPGPETFEQFIERHLYSIRYAYVAADGVINPVSALSDGRVERLFAAEDDETISDLAVRLKSLASVTGSTRFFFSRLVPVAEAVPGAPQMTADGADWNKALLWYAEDKKADLRRQGAMATLSMTALGESKESSSLGGVIGEVLHSVLA